MGRVNNHPELPDIQSKKDNRGIDLYCVGVKNVELPITIKFGSVFQQTVANFSAGIKLPHDQKGAHMSRLVEILQEIYVKNGQVMHIPSLGILLSQLKERCEAKIAHATVEFPFWLYQVAPETRKSGLDVYRCKIEHSYEDVAGALFEKHFLTLSVNTTTLCPCSKEISNYGAHNQRAEIKIRVTPLSEGHVFNYFYNLVDLAQESSSCRLYPILKRPDEKAVTEQAYDKPRFVEDVVRELVGFLVKKDKEHFILREISCESMESIHNHNAIAEYKVDEGNWI